MFVVGLMIMMVPVKAFAVKEVPGVVSVSRECCEKPSTWLYSFFVSI